VSPHWLGVGAHQMTVRMTVRERERKSFTEQTQEMTATGSCVHPPIITHTQKNSIFKSVFS